jgi:hypothetical protein
MHDNRAQQDRTIYFFVEMGHQLDALQHFSTTNVDYDFTPNNEQIQLLDVIRKQRQTNGWFTEESIWNAVKGIRSWLHKDLLQDWLGNYTLTNEPKKILLIMAGNIPLVGFHDFLCALLSGHHAVCKLSSKDDLLFPHLVNMMRTDFPDVLANVSFSNQVVGTFDAVIATGSDNSFQYFNQYFGKYPHIFRKNRTSVAVIQGNETHEELHALGRDIFTFFGLGCRNVTFLLVPEGYEFNHFFESIVSYGDIIHHHKYANNYDYHRALFLLNKVSFFDNHFLLIREDSSLFSPVSVLHVQYYKSDEDRIRFLSANHENIQVVVGHGACSFGLAQLPDLSDYADEIDTMKFLSFTHA